jgi:hypothetical protein
MTRPHGTILFVTLNSMCQNQIGPHMSLPHHLPSHPAIQLSTSPCHMSVWTAQSAVQTVQSTKILHAWQSRQNAISLAYNVCLNPLKLHWDHVDRVYARVCFQEILSTLIFEHILIPWITRPHWEAFGPPKDYFHSI